MNHRLSTLILGTLLASGLAHADTVRPTFDVSGSWTVGAAGGANAWYQEGTALTYVNITGGFAHQFVGRYISKTKIEGIQHRVDRSNGCSTEMLITVTVTSADAMSVSSKSLDGYCDLPKGEVREETVSRLL